MDRIDLYLQYGMPQAYCNTKREEELVNKFVSLYTMAKNINKEAELFFSI